MPALDRLREAFRALVPAPVPVVEPAVTGDVSGAPGAAVADAGATIAGPGRLRAVADRLTDLFAGRFLPRREDAPTSALDDRWEPRTPYPDPVLDMLGRTGLARRILALRALDATREGWETRFPSAPTPEVGKAASKRLDTMQKALGAQFKLYLGLLKSEQFGEAIVVMGADDGQPLDAPLDKSRVSRVLWLKVFARPDYVPGPLSPPTSDNFDLPEHYEISDFYQPTLRSLDGAQRASGMVKVHHSRVLRFATEEGHSRLDEVAQALEDYFSTMRSGRRATSVFSLAVWKVKDWASAWMKDAEAATNRVALQHQAMKLLGAVVMDPSDDFKWQGQPTTGLPDLISKAESQLCAWTGYPIMILFGADPAGFSTGGEVIRHYYDTVHVWQTLRIEPQLRRLVEVLMVCEDGPRDIVVAPDDWSIVFRPLRVLTAEEQAKVRDVVARTLVILKNAQILDRAETRASLPHDGDDVPDIRLDAQAFTDERERMEVGIVQAIANIVATWYQQSPRPPAAAMEAVIASLVPELADRVAEFFQETPPAVPGAPEGGGDDLAAGAGPTAAEVEAEAAALASEPEQWLEADEVRRHFSVSKATLRKHRADRRGAAVDPGPGRYRWIAPDGRPRYRLSEVRAVLEAGGVDLDGDGVAGDPAVAGPAVVS